MHPTCWERTTRRSLPSDSTIHSISITINDVVYLWMKIQRTCVYRKCPCSLPAVRLRIINITSSKLEISRTKTNTTRTIIENISVIDTNFHIVTMRTTINWSRQIKTQIFRSITDLTLFTDICEWFSC